ncbi:hypothetical protein JNW90_07100 [Micromonospora sp. STR1s_5]|nr:hypothetical protein [Micromonospora sp. STR1s_5]
MHKTLSADAVSELDPPPGTDMNFGSSPNLFTTTIGGRQRELLGIGQKSGDYWALDRTTAGWCGRPRSARVVAWAESSGARPPTAGGSTWRWPTRTGCPS